MKTLPLVVFLLVFEFVFAHYTRRRTRVCSLHKKSQTCVCSLLFSCVCYSLLTIAVFVFDDANVHHSEWLESVSLTDRHGRDALNFCNLSGCEKLVRCPTHIAGNRLDLVMTDVTDIVDVFVGLF